MATEIRMPQLSDTMNAGKILRWNKNPGDKIQRGDILAEVETEKANLEIEAFVPGTLLQILTPALSTAQVGDVIAYIGDAGEAVPASGAQTAKPAPSVQAAPQVAEPQAAPGPLSASGPSDSDRIKVSPLARKIAESRQVDLTRLHGSGPNGRIIKKDVELAATGSSSQPAVSYQPSTQPSTQEPRPVPVISSGEGRLTPFSKMRETIARRMQEAVTQAPHFYTTISIDMGEAAKLRETLKERPEFKGISINHLVMKAVAYALQREPRANRSVRDNQVYEPGQINIGIITAVEDGLLIPVVKNVDSLPLKDLVFEAKAAVERARAGRPTSSDLTGGTFSISNMGMFDVENFTAIISPGQGAVLAVSSVREEPAVKNGQIVIASKMKVTLSVDHRVIDGVMAGTFLKFFKEALETPALMFVA